MSIKVYNSLTRKKDSLEENLEYKNRKEVNIYSCGVTVYDECHIGHARSLYIFDVIRRYLEYKGFKVNFVRNITDIDDKIINRANEFGKDWKQLADEYIRSYKEDLQSLSIREGFLDKDGEEPRATKNIEEIKRYITALIDKGYAYTTDTGVYFSVRKFKEYGKLSGQSIDQMLEGVRKTSDETKLDPLDFALWKISKPNEPWWDSPWGNGRPGWHIECSVMSQKYLKADTLDIHAGGRDLIFPHHENEIAQSEALTGKPFANIWIHHGLLTINNQKMSKSLGNFVTIKDALKKYPADVLKVLYLQAHYSSPVDYTDERMEEKRTALYKINIFLEHTEKILKGEVFPVRSGIEETKSPEDFKEFNKKAKVNFCDSMSDDFNTPNALAVLFEIVRFYGILLYGLTDKTKYFDVIKDARNIVLEFGRDVFGLSFQDSLLSMPEEEIEYLIKFRDQLRIDKKFEEADRVRKELEEKGIIFKFY